MYQKGRNMKPAAATGTRKKFPITMDKAAPAANKSWDTVHKAGNMSSLSVAARMPCTSSISLRRYDFFFRLVSSSISSRMPFGLPMRRLNIFPVKSFNLIRNNKNVPMIIPRHATTCNVSMSCRLLP